MLRKWDKGVIFILFINREQDIKTKVFLYDKVYGFAKKSTSNEQQYVKMYNYLLDHLLTVFTGFYIVGTTCF